MLRLCSRSAGASIRRSAGAIVNETPAQAPSAEIPVHVSIDAFLVYLFASQASVGLIFQVAVFRAQNFPMYGRLRGTIGSILSRKPEILFLFGPTHWFLKRIEMAWPKKFGAVLVMD